MNHVKKIVPYGLALIIAGVVALPVFSKSIIMDEAYSMLLVQGSIGEIISGTAIDVHPPLYYLILKVLDLVPGGQTICGYRLITVLATFLNLLWLGATKIRKRWGNRVAIIYILWYGLCNCTWERSAMVRMYSWGTFFVTAALLFMFAYYENRRRRDYVASILYTIAAMYTHYYAVMAVFVAWVMLLACVCWKERRLVKNVLVAGIIIGVAYIPWMGVVISQSMSVAKDYWIDTFSWKQWITSPAELIECSLEGMGVVFYFLSVVVVILALLQRKWLSLCGMGVFVGTMLLGAMLSVFVAPIWTVRYLYMAWGAYALFIALALGDGKSVPATIGQGLVLVLLAVANVFSVQSLLQSPVMNTTAEQWVAFLEENVTAGDCIIVDDPYEHYIVYEFYAPETEVIMTEELTELGGAIELGEVIAQYKQNNIWYVNDQLQYRYGVENMSASLENAGCGMEHIASYTIQDKVLHVYKAEVTNYEK